MKQQTKKRLINTVGTIILIGLCGLVIKTTVDDNNEKKAEEKARTEQVNKVNQSIKVLSESQVEMNKSIDELKKQTDSDTKAIADTEKRMNARIAEVDKQMADLSSKL